MQDCKEFRFFTIYSTQYCEKIQWSLEISVHVEQGWKPLLNFSDLRAFRCHCVRNRHATVVNTATCTQGYFGKPVSLNIVRRCIKKYSLKLDYARRKPCINSMQKRHRVLCAWAHLRWTERRWKNVLYSDESTFQVVVFLGGKTDVKFSVPKTKGAKPNIFHGMGVHQCPCMGN